MSEAVQERVSSSAEATHALGMALAARLRRGDCVALSGDLGSGKTCLVQGICEGLQVTDPVTSPTFVLINEYAGTGSDGDPMPVYHFDLYRLGDPDELEALGCDDFFYGNGVCLIEWAELGGDLIPDTALQIRFEHVGPNARRIFIRGGKTC